MTVRVRTKSIAVPVTFSGGILLDMECDWIHVAAASSCGVLELIAGESRLVQDVPLEYLRAEFPSEFVSNATDSLVQFFVKRLPADPRIEHVYWSSEDDVLKIWTVIPEPDFALEGPLYAAQMFFMEKFPEVGCDFSVIYRFDKATKDIEPQGAHRLF